MYWKANHLFSITHSVFSLAKGPRGAIACKRLYEIGCGTSRRRCSFLAAGRQWRFSFSMRSMLWAKGVAERFSGPNYIRVVVGLVAVVVGVGVAVVVVVNRSSSSNQDIFSRLPTLLHDIHFIIQTKLLSGGISPYLAGGENTWPPFCMTCPLIRPAWGSEIRVGCIVVGPNKTSSHVTSQNYLMSKETTLARRPS